MPIIGSRDFRLIVQGITGREGAFHTLQMVNSGTNIVGGVTPGKGGEWVHGIPVFDSVRTVCEITEANATVIFVPAASAADAIYEAIDAGLTLVVCITEGIPVQDTIKVCEYAQRRGVRLIGPNSPGFLVPGQINVGLFPDHIGRYGSVGVVSRSGTLTYEVVHALSSAGIGQSTCIGIGGDPVLGTGLIEILDLFENDPETSSIVLLGEIGGRAEIDAAEFIKSNLTKPITAFIAGRSAPEGIRMGHAGAIVERGEGTAQEKIRALQDAGVRVADSPEDIPGLVSG